MIGIKRHRTWAETHLRVGKAYPLTAAEKLRTKLAALALFVFFMLIVLPH
jgi:hypothetical protein